MNKTANTLINKKNKTQLMKAIAGKSTEDKWKEKFFSVLRSQDMFGKHVVFTYKGRKTY